MRNLTANNLVAIAAGTFALAFAVLIVTQLMPLLSQVVR